jgi:hypothetical protein
MAMRSLKANTSVALVKWPSHVNGTLVEISLVYAKIPGYPGLWQLYNETTGVQLARPVDGGYLVYYDPFENTVFCDWDRLVE